MSQLLDLLVIAALLLIPLIPAAVLYKALTPKRGTKGKAGGEWSSEGIAFGKVSLSFSVVGSTATYVVLLGTSIFTYLHLQNQAEKRAERIAQSMMENQAWTVRVPVRLRDAAGNVQPDDGITMHQIQVQTQPDLISKSANDVTFRVITSNGKFPTARIFISKVGSASLDLNDSDKVRVGNASRQITGIEPVWISMNTPYDAANGEGTPMPPPANAPQGATLGSPSPPPASMGNLQ